MGITVLANTQLDTLRAASMLHLHWCYSKRIVNITVSCFCVMFKY